MRKSLVLTLLQIYCQASWWIEVASKIVLAPFYIHDVRPNRTPNIIDIMRIITLDQNYIFQCLGII